MTIYCLYQCVDIELQMISILKKVWNKYVLVCIEKKICSYYYRTIPIIKLLFGWLGFGLCKLVTITSTLAHFLGFEFLVRNEENILLSHEKRGKFEESLNSLYLPNFKFYCILIWQFLTKFSEFKKFSSKKAKFCFSKTILRLTWLNRNNFLSFPPPKCLIFDLEFSHFSRLFSLREIPHFQIPHFSYLIEE